MRYFGAFFILSHNFFSKGLTMKPLFFIIMLGFLASSCSSLFEEEKKDCSTTDFVGLGQLATQSGNADSYLTSFQSKCTQPLTSQNLDMFKVGVARENEFICTGYRNFNKDNWTALGADVATRGEKENYYLDFKAKCSLQPNKNQLADYKNGYRNGLKSLCTKAGGVEFSRKNYAYKSTCPAKSENEFNAGRMLGDKLREADTLHKEIKLQADEITRYEKENVELDSIIGVCKLKLENFKDGVAPNGYYDCRGTSIDSIRGLMNDHSSKIKNNKLKILDHQRQIIEKKNDSEKLYRDLEILGKAGAI